MINRNEYFITYVNYPLTKKKNKKEHIKFFEMYNVTEFWGPTINVRSLLKHNSDIGPKDIEIQRNEIFKNVLNQIIAGIALKKIQGMEAIENEILKDQPRRFLRTKTNKKGVEKVTESEVWNPLAYKTQGDRFYHLACHSLMHFLKGRDNPKRLQQCHYCPRFMIVRNTRMTTCGSDECFQRRKATEKKKWRAKTKKIGTKINTNVS